MSLNRKREELNRIHITKAKSCSNKEIQDYNSLQMCLKNFVSRYIGHIILGIIIIGIIIDITITNNNNNNNNVEVNPRS